VCLHEKLNQAQKTWREKPQSISVDFRALLLAGKKVKIPDALCHLLLNILEQLIDL
jgi:hypothetical protein